MADEMFARQVSATSWAMCRWNWSGSARWPMGWRARSAAAFRGALIDGKSLKSVLGDIARGLCRYRAQGGDQAAGESGGRAGGEPVHGDQSGAGGVKPFAKGGVIAAPGYFPMGGGLGLAGEAGPEAIMPLARGSDGRLGVAGGRRRRCR